MIPDNVEKIIMTKEDYDRNVEQLLVEKLELQQELQRKDNIINDLKSSIADYQEAVGDYQDELKRQDNIINEMKKASDEIFHKYPYERKKWFDKIKELENGNK